MLNVYDFKLAEQHREKLETEAENWRKAKPKETYQPNPALRHKRRKH